MRPWGSPDTPPKGVVPRYPPRGVLRDCSRPVPGSCRGVVSPLTGGFPHTGVNLAQQCCIGGPRHRQRRARNERALRSPGSSCACEAGKDTLMALEAA